ncbi:MAG: hypothetical protein ABW023_09580 [Sphingomonas sp.]
MPGEVGSSFRIDSGDGDPDFFRYPITARRVSETWFSDTLPRGEAFLLLVTGGQLHGEYLAITSRQARSLSSQLSEGPWVSVVVHRVLRPGDGFESDPQSLVAVGMAVAEAV